MLSAARLLVVFGTIVVASSFLAAQGSGGEEMVANPYYKYWANCKPGSTVTLVEKTTLNGPEKALVPDGLDEKVITCNLVSVKTDQVVVQFVVNEREFLSWIESSPTKKTYPAMVKKTHLIAGLHGVDPKKGEDTIDVLGKKLACVTLSGTEKKEGVEVEHKIWISDKVPGGVVKHTRVTKADGKLVADTSITVKAYKNAN